MLNPSTNPDLNLKMNAKIIVVNDATANATGKSPVPTDLFCAKKIPNAMTKNTENNMILIKIPSVTIFMYKSTESNPVRFMSVITGNVTISPLSQMLYQLRH